MTCDQIEELLSDLIDDELPAGARAGVEAHIASCDRCARSYRALERTVRFVRANSRPRLAPHTPGGIYADFTRAISDQSYGRDPVEVLVSGITDLMPEQSDNVDRMLGRKED